MRKGTVSFSRFQRALRRIKRHVQGYSHHQVLERLASIGFVPQAIYDIGAHNGSWTELARKTFPNSDYVLCEANPNLEQVLKRTGERYFITALSNVDDVSKTFHLPPNPAVSTTGGSFYRGERATTADANSILIKTSRLETLQRKNQLTPPDLIKLDVEGAELEILRGAGNLLERCSAIICELSFVRQDGAPAAHDIMKGIFDMGFVLVDLCKIRRTSFGNVCQIDALFARPALLREFQSRAGTVSQPVLTAQGQ